MTRLNSYLLFDSTCKEAMDFLQEQPFGYCGAFDDRFGVRWMFRTDQK